MQQLILLQFNLLASFRVKPRKDTTNLDSSVNSIVNNAHLFLHPRLTLKL